MLTIYDDATLIVALATPLNDTCRDLICRIASDARTLDLWDTLTAIVLIADDDTAADFEAVLGYPPCTGLLGGEGAAAVPYWSWREAHGPNGDTVELLVPAGDEGFCWFLLMSRAWFDSRIGIE